MIDWIIVNELTQIDELVQNSYSQPQIIFKHSTTCSISQMSKLRFESAYDLELDCYYLDLLAFRSISNHIAEKFSVHHESPQLLLIDKGECVFDASHFDISVAELKEVIDFSNH